MFIEATKTDNVGTKIYVNVARIKMLMEFDTRTMIVFENDSNEHNDYVMVAESYSTLKDKIK